MKTFLVVLVSWVLSCATGLAMTVHMKNDEQIEAQKAWRQGDTIYVQINRDLLIDFPASEVNLRKTKLMRVKPVKEKKPSAVANAWWVGSWELDYDPDGNEKDYIDFFTDGKADSRGGDGTHRVCTYEVRPTQIVISFTVNGARKTIALEIVEKGQRLRNSSGAEYTKVKETAGIEYSRLDWNRFSSSDGAFSALMFGVPTLKMTKFENSVTSSDAYLYSSMQDEAVIFALCVPLSVKLEQQNIDKTYANYEKIVSENMDANGLKILQSKSRFITLYGLKAKEITGIVASASTKMNFKSVATVNGNVLYQFSVLTKPGHDSIAHNFFNSLKFTQRASSMDKN